MYLTLTPTDSSMNSTYTPAFFGNSSNVFAPIVGSFHPGRVSYTTSAFASRSRSAGKDSNPCPLTLHAVATGISAKSSRISNLVRFRESQTFTSLLYFTITRSSQPQRYFEVQYEPSLYKDGEHSAILWVEVRRLLWWCRPSPRQ